MKRIIFDYKKSIFTENAKNIFYNISGLNRNGKKYERMCSDAELIGQIAAEMFEPKIQCIYTKNVRIDGNKAFINEICFECTGFERVVPESVNGALIYALTAGNFELPDDEVINQLYADIWGTAYTDAVRLHIKEQLEEIYALSDSFGPGFYGMDVSETAKITSFIDFDELGIELKNNSILVPLKSCTGIYFTVDDKYEPLNTECAGCHGNHSSCRLCRVSQEET